LVHYKKKDESHDTGNLAEFLFMRKPLGCSSQKDNLEGYRLERTIQHKYLN